MILYIMNWCSNDYMNCLIFVCIQNLIKNSRKKSCLLGLLFFLYVMNGRIEYLMIITFIFIFIRNILLFILT